MVELSKIFETKKKILALLKENNMTITELSQQLGLSTQTVGQHIAELQEMGAIEKIDSEHFKKLKIYKVNERIIDPVVARYVVSAIAVIAILSVLYFYRGSIFSHKNTGTTLYLGSNISVGNLTVQLSGLVPSNGISLATLSVYNKGMLINQSTLAPGSSGVVNSGGLQLNMSVLETSNSSSQQWARINLQSSNSTASSSTITQVLVPPPLPSANATTTLYPPAFPN